MIESIKIKWHISDVLTVRDDLCRCQASKVLKFLADNHEADVGINWDVIRATANMIFPREGEL